MASNGTNLGLRTWRAFAQYLLLIGLFLRECARVLRQFDFDGEPSAMLHLPCNGESILLGHESHKQNTSRRGSDQ